MLVEEIIDQAAYLRNDNPVLIKRGLSGRQIVSLFEVVFSEVTQYSVTYTGGRDRWGVPNYVDLVDLARVNTNLVTASPTFSGLARPLNFPGTYVPLTAFNGGVLTIPIPAITTGAYTFSMDTSSDSATTQTPQTMVWNAGSWNIEYWQPSPPPTFEFTDDFVVSLRYPATTQTQRITMYMGHMKIYGVIDYRGQIPPTAIEVQTRKNRALGGFKLEQGRIATPSRVGAKEDLESLHPYQIESIGIDIAPLTQKGTQLFGRCPEEFEMLHNAKRVVPALTTDLGRVDTETKMALAYGLAHHLDMATLDGVVKPQANNRMRKYQEYKSRVQNRGLYTHGKINWSLDV